MTHSSPDGDRLVGWLVGLAVLAILVAVASAIAFAASHQIIKRAAGGTTQDPCELSQHTFDTSGSRYEETSERPTAGLRLFRVHRNSSPYSSVVGCRASGEFVAADEIFELVRSGGESAEDLAALHSWCFGEGGLVKIEIMTRSDGFVALHGSPEGWTPPTTRRNIVSFLRAERYESWGPQPMIHHYVIDSHTGLGGEVLVLAHQPSPRDSAVLAGMLRDPLHRYSAFHALAVEMHMELSSELLLAIEEDTGSDRRYLGLMALRDHESPELAPRVAALADAKSTPLLRVGIVQTLATVRGGRGLAVAIAQREVDARAARTMRVVLKE